MTQNTVSAPLQPLIPSQSDTQRLDHQHDDDGGGDDEDDDDDADDDDDTDNVLVDICFPIF